VLSQLFFACKKDDEPIKIIKVATMPGSFVVTPYAGVTVNSASEFELGDLFATYRYVFMLANDGGNPIFDVTLTSDKLPFEVTPKTIQVLPGKNENASPVSLTLDISHGVSLDLERRVPALPAGENKAIIRLKGKTLLEKDTIEVIKEFTVSVYARVMDAKILSGDIDAVLGTTFYDTSIPALIVEPSKTVKFVNTGNVAIRAVLDHDKNEMYTEGGMDMAGPYFVTTNEITVEPGQAADITNFVAPFSGMRTEGDKKYNYYGNTGIILSSKTAAAKIVSFSLSTR
jgi:hypothetical protein